MSEIFAIVCKNVSVSVAPQDILSAYASSSKKLQLVYFEISANGQATVQNYPLSFRYLPATVTTGSGGSSNTPKNLNPNGASASFTARQNDTTPATTGGTAADIVATQFNPITGYNLPPMTSPEDAPLAELSSAFVLSLDAVTGTLGISATVWLREI